MNDGVLHSVSVSAIVVRPKDGKVLVIQRADDQRWVPPGGVLELAETPSSARFVRYVKRPESRSGRCG